MKIYTKTGDAGLTDLYAGGRVPKDHPRMEVLGEMDELNCVLGVLRSCGLPPEEDAEVNAIQQQLFMVGSELACLDPDKMGVQRVLAEDVAALETKIDAYSAKLPPLKHMLCPEGCPACAFCQFARAVCRRVERRMVAAIRESEPAISPIPLHYFNRLSDFLFVLGRYLDR